MNTVRLDSTGDFVDVLDHAAPGPYDGDLVDAAGWLLVRVPDGFTCWVPAKATTVVEDRS